MTLQWWKKSKCKERPNTIERLSADLAFWRNIAEQRNEEIKNYRLAAIETARALNRRNKTIVHLRKVIGFLRTQTPDTQEKVK